MPAIRRMSTQQNTISEAFFFKLYFQSRTSSADNLYREIKYGSARVEHAKKVLRF